MPLDKNGTPQPSIVNSKKFRDNWDDIFNKKDDYISGVCDFCLKESNKLIIKFSKGYRELICSDCKEN